MYLRVLPRINESLVCVVAVQFSTFSLTVFYVLQPQESGIRARLLQQEGRCFGVKESSSADGSSNGGEHKYRKYLSTDVFHSQR